MNDTYLTNDVDVTDDIMEKYVVYLLEGFTLQKRQIQADTIYGYMRCVNDHYRKKRYLPPFAKKSDTTAARLLIAQAKVEDAPDKREPLHDKVIVRMYELSLDESCRFGARKAIWNWTSLGRFGGYRRQEFAMDKSDEIQYYVKPNGELIVRAFTLSNFIFYDDDGMPVDRQACLNHRPLAQQLGQEYDIQKNRMNGQIITVHREPAFPPFCPVELGLDIVEMAMALGAKEPDDPLCLYRTSKGDIKFITGDMITRYYRFVTKMVFPHISDEMLKLISTHSLRVKAAVLLHEAGKDGTYIKLRIRWLSDCFEVYLRNTPTICAQHNTALHGVNQQMMAAIAVSQANLPRYAVQNAVAVDESMIDIEDDD